MSQSTIIFCGLLFAYFVFITSKGELATYLAFFGIGGVKSPAANKTSGSGGSSGSGASTPVPSTGGTGPLA